ncbi:hypothetical protein ACIBCH_32380 [Amycolatopsis thailandensis]|uniref:hypothetical protein n=1 Tax=Amycolatopsis thailandensis TaxID=589330 RepID=UPI00378A74FB
MKEAAGRFLGAVASGSHRSACALPAPKCCERALAAAKIPDGAPETVSVWSEEAQVKTTGDTLFLHESSTGWLVTARAATTATNRSAAAPVKETDDAAFLVTTRFRWRSVCCSC